MLALQPCLVDEVGKLAGGAVAVGHTLLLQQHLELGPQRLRLVLQAAGGQQMCMNIVSGCPHMCVAEPDVFA